VRGALVVEKEIRAGNTGRRSIGNGGRSLEK
jgi:hypothetical protein